MAHTEMCDPGGFARSDWYRWQMVGDDESDFTRQGNDGPHEDRPLVLQLGSSNVDKLLDAVKTAVALRRFDAIELNCGW